MFLLFSVKFRALRVSVVIFILTTTLIVNSFSELPGKGTRAAGRPVDEYFSPPFTVRPVQQHIPGSTRDSRITVLAIQISFS